MHISELDYVLPPELIAQEPLPERDASRLMVVHRATKTIEHRMFRDLPAFLRPGDLVVLNDTKVKPVRLYGKRSSTGGAVEIFLLDELRDGRYHAMTGSGGKLDAGERVLIVETDKPDAQPRLMAILENKLDDGTWNIRMEVCGGGGRTDAIATLVNEIASMPLPPYIKRTRFDDPRSKQDRQRYQTVFACKEGAVAAPTAGLHFTAEMLEGLARNGVERCFVTLHVGRGTFLPVKVESLADHVMHGEYFEITASAADAIKTTKHDGGRVVAVGTTVTRVLESCAKSAEGVRAQRGDTDLMIVPGYRFAVVDILLTNFHLPKSTLLALVMAFAGVELTREAYRKAMEEQYRFFSYGDAMLVI